jgi:hypothetical protein
MKEIQLTQGKVALVDDYDYEVLNNFKWFAHKHRNTHYAGKQKSRTEGKQRSELMHCIIMDHKGIDHIDGNGLNNQRSNLRFATHQQNQMNRGKLKGTSSKYKGVSLDKRSNKWNSYIKKDQKVIYLGLYYDEVEAAKAYDQKAIELFGEFARLNFNN